MPEIIVISNQLWRHNAMEAKQIWISNENNINTWVAFAKDIELEQKPDKFIAKIAVDSKYWLWINGNEVVFEGGVKRGPHRNATYFDQLDIAPYLTSGKNRLAFLVCYFGDDGFSHISSGAGGLWFESELLVSDESWKAKKHPAYVEADPNDATSNFRMAESNVYFDAGRDIGTFYASDYDISGWQSADIVSPGSFGDLFPRMIPFIKDYGNKSYVNSSSVSELTVTKDTIFAMKLPYNAQITPCLRVTAPEGLRISVMPENYYDALYDTKSVMAVYYTKDGYQQYESLGWMNGETMYYSIPAGVTIHELSYRETGYDTEFVGDFRCDDDFLNKLWEKSRRTLYITMRDNFMDCPDRERAQWWGDVNVEMQMMMYCMDKKSHDLYKKGVLSMAGFAKEAGHMLTVVPSGKDQFELPMQNLAGIYGFMLYYDYTQDISVVEMAYPMSKQYLQLFDMQENGLVAHRTGSWDWPDWGDNADISVMENAWYYMALDAAIKMAKLLGMEQDVSFYQKRRDSIKANFNKEFYKGAFYYNETDNGQPDDRANALAVLSGLAKKAFYPDIIKILNETENSSPYMEYYVLESMCEMGYIDDAIIRMKRRYQDMVLDDYSTLWEYWDTSGTKNHAWSGGPLVILSKYYAGQTERQ